MARRTYDTSTPGGRLGALIQALWRGPSARSFALAVGIDPVTLSRLVNGTTDLRKSDNLGSIAEQLGVDEGVILYGPIDHYLNGRDAELDAEPDEHQSATDRLLALLKLHAGTRRIAGVLSQRGQTLLTVAYTIALDDNWPIEEIRKIDALRDEILEEEKTGGG